MKTGYTHVSFVLDNSQSMNPLKEETMAGYNSFVSKQKLDPGKMTFSLYQFLGGYYPNHFLTAAVGAPVFGGMGAAVATPLVTLKRELMVKTTYEFLDIQNIPELTHENYSCDTWTPLLDSIGYGIESTGARLASMNESDRPEKVIFVILTDGDENQSRGFTKDKINEMITHQREAYKWDFIFLGANQDAIKTGTGYGISAGSSMTYGATVRGMSATYNHLSASVSASKTSGLDTVFDSTARADVLDGK
jgi:hypothetical protein